MSPPPRKPKRPAVRVLRGLACLLMVSGLACGSPDQAHTFEIVEEDGVPVAVNSAIPRYEGEIFTYEKVLEIRADPDDPETLLYEPMTFSLGDDGLYYVADTGNDRVAVFDAEGKLVRTIGRRGDGPGEFRGPHLVDVEGGIVTVQGQKTSRFRTDGTFIDEVRSPSPPAHRTSEGSYVTFENPQGPREDGYYYLATHAVVVSESGERLARVESRDVPWARMGDGRRRHQVHYAPWPVAAFVPPDQILMTVGDEPVVSWFDLDGRLLRRMRIEADPEPLTAVDRARVHDHYDRLIEAARAAGGDDLAERLTADKAALELADPKAYWRDMTWEAPGWLWLRDSVPDIGVYVRGSAQITQPQSFRIVDPGGELVGRTSWPAEARHFGTRIMRGHLLTMIPDPETEETIPTAFVIRPAVEGLDYPR